MKIPIHTNQSHHSSRFIVPRVTTIILALAAMFFAAFSASAALTTYSWQRFLDYKQPGNDNSGNGHPISGGFTGNGESPFGTEPQLYNIEVGGPLGPDGIYSYASIRSRANANGNQGCAFEEPFPVSAQTYAGATKTNTTAWGNLFQTNSNWAVECWALPTRIGGGSGVGAIFYTGLNRNNRSVGLQQGVIMEAINGTDRANQAQNDGHVWLRCHAACPPNQVDTNGLPQDFYIGPPILWKTPTNAAWMHIAVVRDEAAGLVSWFTNGVLVASTNSSRVVWTNQFASPGFAGLQDSGWDSPISGGIGVDTGARPFEGYIAELRWSYFTPGTFSLTNLLTRRAAPGSTTLYSGPAVVNHPQSVTVWAGAAAPFTVTAATDTDVTYQWQRGAVNIANATNRAYALENTSVGADNGAQFRCILSKGVLSATSTVATVTVVANSASLANGYSNAVMSQASLVAYFPMDGSTGSVLNNSKEPARTGGISNAPFARFSGNTNFAAGNQALALNSPNLEYAGGFGLATNQHGYVEIAGDNAAFNFANSGGNGTISCVVSLDGSARQALSTELLTFLSSGTTFNSFDYYNFAGDINGNLYFQSSGSGGQRIWSVPGGLIGKRTHLVFVFSNTTNITAYANGLNLGTRTINGFGNTPPSLIQPITIGKRGGEAADNTGYFKNAWRGTVDDLAIYSTSLSASTIAAQYYTLVNGTAAAGPSVVSISPSKSLYVGYPVQVLNVSGGGSPPLSYQWRLNGVAVAGSTNSSASVPSLAAGTYTYTVVITNAVAPFATTSAPVVLTVVAPTGYGAKVYASSGGGPRAFYPLDETSGTTILDWAGTHDGVISGGYQLGGVGPVGGTGSIKMFGTNILNPLTQIDTSSAVTVPYYPELNPENGGNFTHEFWYKPDNTNISSCPVSSTYAIGVNKAGMSTIIGNGVRGIAQTTINNWTMIYGKYNNVNQGVSQNGTGGQIPSVAGEWQHIASVADGNNSTVTIYVNGQPDFTQNVGYSQHPLDASTTGGVNQNYFAPLTLGNYNLGTFPMQGSLSQVAIYDYALNFNDVTNHTSQIWTQAFITLQPVAVTAVESLGTVQLTANALGVPNNYQWYKNGSPLVNFPNLDGSSHYPLITNTGGASQGVISKKLVINQPKTNDTGVYFLQVINPLNAGGFTNTVSVNVTITPDTTVPFITAASARGTTISGPVLDEATAGSGNPTPAPLNLVEVNFSKRMDPGSATNVANYTISGGVSVTNVVQATSVADTKFGGDYRAVGLNTTGLTPGGSYTLTVANVYDQATFSNKIGTTTIPFTAPILQTGKAVWNYYYRLGTGNFTSLQQGTNGGFPYVPQYTVALTNMSSDSINPGQNLGNVSTFSGQGDNYVSTITAWATPTNTGYFEFFVNGDDAARLYLNPSGSDPAGAQWIGDAFSGTTKFNDVYAIPTHYLLTAGQAYFLQIVSTEATGGDSARAGWRYLGTVDSAYDGSGANGAWIVNATNLPAIEGQFLSAYTVAPISVAAPSPSTVVAAAGANAAMNVVGSGGTSPLTYQWLQNGANASSTTRSNLFLPVAFANYSSNWTVRVSDGLTTVTSTAAALVPPGGVTFTSNPTNKARPQGVATSVGAVATTTSGRINYQWQLSGANVTGANYGNATSQVVSGGGNLTIASMQPTNAGPYTLVANDGWYSLSVTSTPGVLTIAQNPTITNSVSGSILSMSFPSEVGPSYVVEFKNALTNGAWNLLQTNVGTGGALTVPVGTTNTQRYFRLRMQ